MQIGECYKVLNVPPGENWRKVRQSYHSLAKQFHPDVNPSTTRLIEINRAFEILESHYKATLQPEQQDNSIIPFKRRKFFDRLQGNPAVQRAFRSGLTFLTELDTKVFQLHIQKDIAISQSTLQKGASLHLRSGKEHFEIKVPSGAWNQMSLRIPGKGESSLFSKRRGDLVLNLRVPTKETAKPENTRYYYDMKIPREQIASGKVFTLHSSEGPIKFILPKNTHDGQRLTLRSGEKVGSATAHILTINLV